MVSKDDLLQIAFDKMTKIKLYIITFSLALCNASDAVEVLSVGYIMTALGDSISSSQKGMLSASVFAGMFIGGSLFGYLSDYFGRKVSLLAALLLNFVAGLLSAISIDVYWLSVCRGVAGIGIGGSVPVLFTLSAELTPASIRGAMLCYIGCFWMIGSMFVALLAWILLGEYNHERILPGVSWRWFAAVCSLPALSAFVITMCCIPESPRFLLMKGRLEEASVALTRISGSKISRESLAASESEIDDVSSTSTGLSQAANTLRVLFGPSLRRTTWILSVIWFSLAFGTFGVTTWISTLFADIGLSNPYQDAFIYSIAQLPGNIFSIAYIEVLGRKRLLIAAMLLSSLAAVGFGLGAGAPEVVIVCSAIFSAGTSLEWNALEVLSVEIFPTSVRSSGMGFVSSAGRLGAMVAQLVNGRLENNIAVLLLVMGASMLLGGACSCLLPPDKLGTTLEDSHCTDINMKDLNQQEAADTEYSSSSRHGLIGVGAISYSIVHTQLDSLTPANSPHTHLEDGAAKNYCKIPTVEMVQYC